VTALPDSVGLHRNREAHVTEVFDLHDWDFLVGAGTSGIAG
jgi:hypothetical protein